MQKTQHEAENRVEEAYYFMYVLGRVICVWANLLISPINKVLSPLGEERKESPTHELESPLIKKVKRAMRRVRKYTPWKKCLVLAIAAKKILNRKKIPSTLYFGLKRNNQGKLEAHAWLRCGNSIITGEKEKNEFSAVNWIS